MGICLTPVEPNTELDHTQTSEKINTYNSNVYIFTFT